MGKRYLELEHSAEPRDFIIRRRYPTLPQLTLLLLSALIIALSITVSVASKPALLSILFILLASVGWYVLVQTQQTRDLLLTTEFQNALFSSALGLNNKFCLIIRSDGAMVYLDRNFQDLFPEFLKQSQRDFGLFLEFANVAQKEREHILATLTQGVPDKAVFSLQGTGGAVHKVFMNIEPIQRPSGFMLLRARDYVEQRSSESPAQATRILAPQVRMQPELESKPDAKKKPW